MELVKLNLGSGKDYRSGGGWLNVDVDPRFKPDVLKDIRDLAYLPDSIDEVLAQDVLDHFTPTEARTIVRHIHEWLKPGGTLRIHTPNLEAVGLLASQGGWEATKWLYGTDGQGSTYYPSNTIKWAYTRDTLRLMLREVGFLVVHAELDCVVKGYAFGFNMVARKNE